MIRLAVDTAIQIALKRSANELFQTEALREPFETIRDLLAAAPDPLLTPHRYTTLLPWGLWPSLKRVIGAAALDADRGDAWTLIGLLRRIERAYENRPAIDRLADLGVTP